jgi:oxalate decarboxylase/phosphoglucose isomerase-like protein (cupin superfamily)
MISESVFLGGRVIRKTLPVLSPQPGAPPLKRLMLPQGELAQFHDGIEPIRYLAYIELRPGALRGNHYHKVKREYVYVIGGKTELLVQDVNSGDRAMVPLNSGDLAFIETGIAHTLRPLTDGQAIEFSAAPFDAADIYRFPLEFT